MSDLECFKSGRDANKFEQVKYKTGQTGIPIVPDNATSFIEAEVIEISKQGAKKMKKYKCLICGYIYDPAVGDPDSDIEAGTAFEALPDDWICPDCGVGKDELEPMED